MRLMNWKQGEHVTLIGPTGKGKTEAMIRLLDERKYCVFITTKQIDETQDQLKDRGYRVESDLQMVSPVVAHKFLFRVPWGKMSEDDYRTKVIPAQRKVLDRLLTKLFSRGGWTIALDELPYVSDQLSLKDTLNLLWLQGRSSKNSVIANTQRPRNVPLAAYSMATHLFIWNTPDSQDIIRNSDFISLDRQAVVRVLRSCEKHDVLYVNINDGHMCVTNTRK